MNDEKHTPSEDWEMSVPEISPPDTEVETGGDGWKMPEPVFRVSEGDKIKKSEIRPLAAEESLPDDFAPDDESSVLAQPDILEDFTDSERPKQTFETAPQADKSENGNTKWVVLLGGIFIFFAVLIGILLGVYFLMW